MRGIRGATTIEKDEREQVSAAVRELLGAILAANPGLRSADIASAIFTVTDDIASAFPAAAARDMGWEDVPMLCTREIPVPGSLLLCVRVLLHWNTEKCLQEIKHVYLRNAKVLRPDWALQSSAQDSREEA
jgi:chorismate mutase